MSERKPPDDPGDAGAAAAPPPPFRPDRRLITYLEKRQGGEEPSGETKGLSRILALLRGRRAAGR